MVVTILLFTPPLLPLAVIFICAVNIYHTIVVAVVIPLLHPSPLSPPHPLFSSRLSLCRTNSTLSIIPKDISSNEIPSED